MLRAAPAVLLLTAFALGCESSGNDTRGDTGGDDAVTLDVGLVDSADDATSHADSEANAELQLEFLDPALDVWPNDNPRSWNGWIAFEYVPSRSAEHEALRVRLAADSSPPRVVAFWTSQDFVLPRTITLSYETCGEPGARLDFERGELGICYELVEHIRDDARFAWRGRNDPYVAEWAANSAAQWIASRLLAVLIIHDLKLQNEGPYWELVDEFMVHQMLTDRDYLRYGFVNFTDFWLYALDGDPVIEMARYELGATSRSLVRQTCISYAEFPELQTDPWPLIGYPLEDLQGCGGVRDAILERWAPRLTPFRRELN